MGDLTSRIHSLLLGSPGMTARELTARLRASGLAGVDKSTVNKAMYGTSSQFRHDSNSPPRWYALPFRREDAPRPSPEQATKRIVSRHVELYPWQEEALGNWIRQGRCGIIEAVTGAGKTRLGLVAASQQLERGGRVLVLVPTIELQMQWQKGMSEYLPGARVGRLGGGAKDDLRHCDVLISVVNSARDVDVGLAGRAGLLIADECHRYGAERNATALKEEFQHRLALSATVERTDGGERMWIEPYFGSRCFSLQYKRALREEVIAHFRVGLIGVSLTADEGELYDHLSDDIRRFKAKLVFQCGIREEPFGEFMKETENLAGSDLRPCRDWARAFLKAFRDRRVLLAETPVKMNALHTLRGAIVVADRTLVFTETIDAAEKAAVAIRDLGISADTIHSEHDREERHSVLERFCSGEVRVVVAPRVLDEGIDVPSADLGIILAASRTRRQMVQRMGRVLRRKDDGRLARFAIVFAIGTSEDPHHGKLEFRAHREFLEEMTDVADETSQFTVEDSQALTTFLSPAHPFMRAGRPKSGRIDGTTRPNRHALF